MIETRPTRLNFMPMLACVDCQQLTNQGLIYQMSALVWQLLPLCATHIEELPACAEPVSLGALRCHIDEQLLVIQHLQRRRRHSARAYARVRRRHAPIKVQRALRWKLNRAYKHRVEAMEVAR